MMAKASGKAIGHELVLDDDPLVSAPLQWRRGKIPKIHYCTVLELLAATEMKVVYSVRNPLSRLVSMAHKAAPEHKHLSLDQRMANIVEYIRFTAEREISGMVGDRSALALRGKTDGRLLWLPYEWLVADPRVFLGIVLSWCGAKAMTDEKLQYAVDCCGFEVLKAGDPFGIAGPGEMLARRGMTNEWKTECPSSIITAMSECYNRYAAVLNSELKSWGQDSGIEFSDTIDY